MISLSHSVPDKEISSNASLDDVKKSIRALYTEKDQKYYSISLFTEYELELQIYTSAIVLQDWGRFAYDGPGGKGELVSRRVKEWAILGAIDQVIEFLEAFEQEKLIELLQSLPSEISRE